mmetsp:Transcript_64646/g.179560  ORF Transcript_64646/g.179560 Transcript_64646/m.179560 type:complete len:254 (+) Transcript_64646:118-879(+)
MASSMWARDPSQHCSMQKRRAFVMLDTAMASHVKSKKARYASCLPTLSFASLSGDTDARKWHMSCTMLSLSSSSALKRSDEKHRRASCKISCRTGMLAPSDSARTVIGRSEPATAPPWQKAFTSKLARSMSTIVFLSSASSRAKLGRFTPGASSTSTGRMGRVSSKSRAASCTMHATRHSEDTASMTSSRSSDSANRMPAWLRVKTTRSCAQAISAVAIARSIANSMENITCFCTDRTLPPRWPSSSMVSPTK